MKSMKGEKENIKKSKINVEMIFNPIWSEFV